MGNPGWHQAGRWDSSAVFCCSGASRALPFIRDASYSIIATTIATRIPISTTPTGGDTSARNSALIYALEAYARRTGRWKAFDSSGGFRLPDGSVLSPDASLMRLERWQTLNPEQRRSFPPLCPDLVVELAGSGDISALRQKMSSYIRNGAQLGWLLLFLLKKMEQEK